MILGLLLESLYGCLTGKIVVPIIFVVNQIKNFTIYYIKMVSAKQLTDINNKGVHKGYHVDEKTFVPQIKSHINGKYRTLLATNSLPKVPRLFNVTPEDKIQMFSYSPAPVLGTQEKIGYETAKGYERYQSELRQAQAYKEYLGSRSLQDAKSAAPSIEKLAHDLSREPVLSHRDMVGENSQSTVNLAPGMPPVGSSRSNGLSINTTNLHHTSSATPDTANRRRDSHMDTASSRGSPMMSSPVTAASRGSPMQMSPVFNNSAGTSEIASSILAGQKRGGDDIEFERGTVKRIRTQEFSGTIGKGNKNDVRARDRPRSKAEQPNLNELRTMSRMSRMNALASKPGTAAEGRQARQRLEQYRRDNNLPPGGRYLGTYNGPKTAYIPVSTYF